MTTRSRFASTWVSRAIIGVAGCLVFSVLPLGGVDGHVYLMEPVSRNFYFTSAFQASDFPDINYCPHCYQSRGPMAVRQRGEENTPADVLEKYGGGNWPLKAVYDLGELASNGNYLEPQEISVRHGICGDPEQTAAEGTNTLGRENSIYPVLDTYEEGAIIEMKVVVSTYHWGHLEYFICDTADLEDGENGAVTQECFNKHPLNRAVDDEAASPIDPKHPGRYFLDPPCRATETDQTKTDGATAGYLVTGRYQLPDGLSCTRCVVQMIYYTGNSCRHPGYEEFSPTSIPGGCAPLVSDWIHLDPPPCGEGFPYPEEFWNCADIAITAGPGSTNSCLDSTNEDYRCSGNTIDLSDCGLTESDVGDLRECFEATGQLETIKKIFARNNDITWLPEDLLTGMDKLVTLNLRDNCNLECIPVLPRDDTVVVLDDCNAEAEAMLCGDVTVPTPAPVAPVATFAPITLLPDDDGNDGNDGSCTTLVGAFGQCGGLNWLGSTCCTEGYACEELAETFSQCSPAPEDDLQDSWEQCGGEGWSGSTECWSGASCVVRNQWYSQCIPLTNLSICSTRLITVEG